MKIEQERSDSRPVVVLGAKPNPNLPAIEPQAVITTKGAVELGLVYRQKYGSRIIAVVPGDEMHTREYMIDLLKKVKPEEIVVLGHKPDFDAEKFIRADLGLNKTKITIYSYFERNFSLTRGLGWRRWIFILHRLLNRKIGLFLVTDLPYIIKERPMHGMTRSTGINGMLYAQERFPDADSIIVSGIGLEAGGHFNGRGSFTEKSAISDRIFMKYWKPAYRKRIVSTDDRLCELGKVPIWTQKEYLETKYS